MKEEELNEEQVNEEEKNEKEIKIEKNEELATEKKDIIINDCNKEENKEENHNVEEVKPKLNNREEDEKSKIAEKNCFPNIDYFFHFVEDKAPLNHVLCGYFQKVFFNLSTYKNHVVNLYLSSL